MSSVLLLTGGPGTAHDFGANAAALADLFRAGDHDVRVVDDPDTAAAALTPDTADVDVDVLAVNALRWRMFDGDYEAWRKEWAYSPQASTRRAVAEFVARGGRLFAAHTATICFDDWPEWADIVGGVWRWGVSSHPPLGPVTVEVVADHPIMAGLPASFELCDEVYGDLEVHPDIDVLAVARRTPDDRDQPVVWAHRYGSGRVVYDAFGHNPESLRDPEHARLIEQALAWLLADG